MTGKLISFSGLAGSGKDTCVGMTYSYLINNNHRAARHVKFSEPLKNMVRGLIMEMTGGDFAEPYIEGHLKEKPLSKFEGVTPRKMMQTLGTDWGRECLYEDFWVDIYKSKAESFLEKGYIVLTSDCRFDNEAEVISDLIAKYGGFSLALEGRSRGVNSSHSSENVPECMHTLVNDGTLLDLQDKINFLSAIYLT